jgi:phospholipid/cholesterol/gamma-HCH transport system substrate-binding protein
MAEPTNSQQSMRPHRATEDQGLERRAGVLVMLLLALLLASGLYLLYARGVFEPTQRLVLLADDSEGVTVGMDLTFSGFAIGRVGRIELADDGKVRILVDVPRKDARWLRQSSVFTMSRGLVGNTSLRAYSGMLDDLPLPDGAVRTVLAGDAGAEIPRLMGQVRDLVGNLIELSGPNSALFQTLENLQTFSGRLAGPGGATAALMGNETDTRRLLEALTRANQLLARLDGLAKRTDGLVERVDGVVADTGRRVLGPEGLMDGVQASLSQAQGLLSEARQSLQRVDALLLDAQATARNVRGATTDLDQLRGEVEGSLRKIDSLVNEINRKWPFKRESELNLP